MTRASADRRNRHRLRAPVAGDGRDPALHEGLRGSGCQREPAAARAPSRQQWDESIRRHNHTVVLSVLAMGFSLDHAQEIAQSTWERLVERHSRGQLDDMRLPGLAIAQARFLALDHRRRQARRDSRTDPIELHPDIAGPPRDDPHQTLVSRERLERTLEALGHCSVQSQRVFRHYYVDGETSAAKVAERIGLSTQRVRQILCDLRKELRVALERE